MLRDTRVQTNQETTGTVQNKNHNAELPKFKFGKMKSDADKAIRAFLTGQVAKFGKYYALPNALVYRTAITPDGGGDMEIAQNVIAMRLNRPDGVLFIGNSSILPLIGRGMTYGKERLNGGVTEVQTKLSQYITMIPFSVFIEAGLNLTKIEILDRGPEETVKRKEVRYDSKTKKDVTTIQTVHYTGASLFKVDGKTFLFDLDRRELEHKIFNAFMVQLKGKATTIAEAYQSLKPAEVVKAEKAGLKVLRQGEWFFIPVKGSYEPKQAKITWGDKKGQMENMALELKAGPNRPNRAQMFAEVGDKKYVTGKVTHDGREHEPLMLKGWYYAIPNTSIESFTLTGDID